MDNYEDVYLISCVEALSNFQVVDCFSLSYPPDIPRPFKGNIDRWTSHFNISSSIAIKHVTRHMQIRPCNDQS